jgi:hypothetical protein
MNFGNFTESTLPIATDFLAGYATGGGAGSDRRYQLGNLFKAQQSLIIGSNFAGDSVIELGRQDGVAGNAVIDFHSGATAVDFDARLIASGGTGSSGGGALAFTGASFNPSANDGATLGTGALSFSDLFLASGGIINFANGDYTLTHATGGLTALTSNASAAMLSLQQNDSGAQGAIINLFHNSTSVAVNDRLGGIFVQGRNSTPATVIFAKMAVDLAINTATAETGAWVFETIQAGTFAERMRITNSPIIYNGTAIPAGGNLNIGYKGTSTANFGVFFGSGAPTINAQAGSLYLRSDGSSTSTRSYISQGGGVWTNLVTAV